MSKIILKNNVIDLEMITHIKFHDKENGFKNFFVGKEYKVVRAKLIEA